MLYASFPVARNRSPKLLDAIPTHETDLRSIFSLSRRGKLLFEEFSPFPVAKSDFSEILIGFPHLFGVS